KSMKTHIEYLQIYIRLHHMNDKNMKRLHKLKHLVKRSGSAKNIASSYINILNRIDDLDMSYIKTDKNLTDNICLMCNAMLESGNFECECGSITPNLKPTTYYGDYEIKTSIESKKMYDFLQNFSCKNIPYKFDNNFRSKFDSYFKTNHMLVGSEVSEYESNSEKISNGYTIMNFYNAMLKLKFIYPQRSIYYYMNLYWEWEIVEIDNEIVDMCSGLSNRLLLYVVEMKNEPKVSIQFCAWWFLLHFDIETDYYSDYKRNKSSSDSMIDSDQSYILMEFSKSYGISIPTSFHSTNTNLD